MPTRIIVPDSDDETEEIVIAEWYHPNGSPVRRGQVICRIEIEDQEYDLAADMDGELRQGIPEGHAVPPGSVVGLIVAEHELAAAPAGVLPQRPRTQRRPSTAFEMASVPDFSSDGIFTEAEPKPVLGRRVLPSRGSARRAAASEPFHHPAQREAEPRPADVHQLRDELVQPAAEPARSPASVIRKLSFGRKRAQPAVEPAEAAEPEAMAPPVPLAVVEPEPVPEPAPAISLVHPTEAPAAAHASPADTDAAIQRDDWAIVESLFEHFDDADDMIEPEDEPADAEQPAPALVAAGPPPPPHVAEIPRPVAVATAPEQAEAEPHSAPERRASRRQEPQQAAMTAVHLMTALIHLDEADSMREQLAEEWADAGVAPNLTDIAVRAIAMAATRLGLVEPGADTIRLVSISPDGVVERVLDDISARSFYELVDERQDAGLHAAGEPFLTVTDLSEAGIESATPLLGEAALAFAMGSVREIARLDGRRATYHPAFALTLAYDPYKLDGPVAAQVLFRVKELIERPYALVAA